jgi:YVTN family beta-propeller protein
MPGRRVVLAGAVLAVSLIGMVASRAAGPPVAGPSGGGSAVTTVGWRVHPAGRQVTVGGRPLGLGLSPDGHTLLVSDGGKATQNLSVVDTSGGVRQRFPYPSPHALFVGVAWRRDGSVAYASGGGEDVVHVYGAQGAGLVERAAISLSGGSPSSTRFPAGLAVSADGTVLGVAENLADSLRIVPLDGGPATEVAVGHRPYDVVLAADGRTAWVTNWGGDSVSVVDVAGGRVRATVAVGTHPSAMTLNPRGHELYVADSDSDTVSVIDTARDRRIRTISLAPYPDAPVGSSPNGLAVAPDGDTLYVANAGNNDVAVVRLAPGRGQGQDHVAGLIPTAWYPTALAVAADGRTLFVANGKGLGAGPNPRGPDPEKSGRDPDQSVASMMQGTLSVIPVPDDATLRRYTAQVRADNGFDRRLVGGRPVAPIRHVIYVIKENRTYDQVMGSLGKGNGDPSLDLFGEESAPNQRALARQFVTLDNFYADAEVSADGWNWSMAGSANTYVQKTWPANYSQRNRSYDFEGGEPATAPGRRPDRSYLWDALDAAGIRYRNYGVWTHGTPTQVATTAPGLAAHTDTAYPAFVLDITDQTRIDEWLREFRRYEAHGDLPTFEFVRLPNDHTAGTKPGSPTPRAMVADNDLALGRLVEAVSHSRFWPTSAVFVVEDDAQDGPDHVDAHRTVAQVISPYTQTGRVDSTFYSTVSMLHTMERILGLAPLSQFDGAAPPMTASFADRPNLAPYTVRVPSQRLDERNTWASPMAAESDVMDFSVEDAAPDDQLDEAIWRSAKAAPSPLHSAPPAGQANGR